MEINFKLAKPSDIDALIDLRQEQGSLGSAAQSRANLNELLGDSSLGKIWLIQHGAELLGYLVLTYSYSLEFHGRDALLDQLYLRKTYQQSEVEIRTIQFATEMARSVGAHALHVRVKRSEIQTQDAYHAVGFEDDDSYLMSKRVES